MQNLLLYELTIPTWHLVLFLSIVGILMLMNKLKFCLLATYLFVFFWVFYLYRADLIAIAAGDRILLAAYHLFGFIIAVLILYPFISPEQSAPARMSVGPEMSNLRKALLKRIDEMELVIKEGESKAMTEVRQSEEEKFGAEAKAALLKTQLEEKADVLQRKEAALKELEENLNGKIQSLEDEVKQKDGLLAMQNGESNGNTSVLEGKASALESQLMDKEEALRARESNARQLEEELSGKIQELETELRQKEELLTHSQKDDLQRQTTEAELEGLKAELRERNLILQAREMEVKIIKQSMPERVRELDKIVQRQPEKESGKSRLGSFLAAIEKRN